MSELTFGLPASVLDSIRELSRDHIRQGSDEREVLASAIWNMVAGANPEAVRNYTSTFGVQEGLDLLIRKTPLTELRKKAQVEEKAGLFGWDESRDKRDFWVTIFDSWLDKLNHGKLDEKLNKAVDLGTFLVTPQHVDWPAGFHDLGRRAPVAIWGQGWREAVPALNGSIAIIGSRAATGYGEHVASQFAQELSGRHFPIVTGGAYGIDAAATRGTILAHGTPVVFLAGGVNRPFPEGNLPLFDQVAARGAILSEYPNDMVPTRWSFLERNRLMAAATRGTLVVEASARSGSLACANWARQLGRVVGAVPGPITSAASAGAHRLIQDFGAVCVTTPEMFAAQVAPERETVPTLTPASHLTPPAVMPDVPAPDSPEPLGL